MSSENDFIGNFLNFNSENKLFDFGDKIIVAVSGGPDSIALLNLLNDLNFDIIAAHVNYQLRGNESLEDERFIIDICKKLKIKLEVKHFNTLEISQKEKKGIQELARNLRYDWFEELANSYSCNKIATAHHQEDQLESILLNITRGSGINGLMGIHAKRGKIIRPLLFTNKEEISNYLHYTKTTYRIDSSNSQNKYNRNYLRNEIIPGLIKINPKVFQHAFDLSMWAAFYTNQLESNRKNRLKKGRIKKQIFISIKEIIESKFPFYFLFNEIGIFGFSNSQAKDILSKIKDNKKGQFYESNSHSLIIDNHQIIIDKIPQANPSSVIIKIPFKLKLNDLVLNIRKSNKIPEIYKQDLLYLDADKVGKNMEISEIKIGDKIKPIGMNGNMKISDILINNKVNKLDKKLCFTLRNQDEIFALIPFKINGNYCIDNKTKNILIISYK